MWAVYITKEDLSLAPYPLFYERDNIFQAYILRQLRENSEHPQAEVSGSLELDGVWRLFTHIITASRNLSTEYSAPQRITCENDFTVCMKLPVHGVILVTLADANATDQTLSMVERRMSTLVSILLFLYGPAWDVKLEKLIRDDKSREVAWTKISLLLNRWLEMYEEDQSFLLEATEDLIPFENKTAPDIPNLYESCDKIFKLGCRVLKQRLDCKYSSPIHSMLIVESKIIKPLSSDHNGKPVQKALNPCDNLLMILTALSFFQPSPRLGNATETPEFKEEPETESEDTPIPEPETGSDADVVPEKYYMQTLSSDPDALSMHSAMDEIVEGGTGHSPGRSHTPNRVKAKTPVFSLAMTEEEQSNLSGEFSTTNGESKPKPSDGQISKDSIASALENGNISSAGSQNQQESDNPQTVSQSTPGVDVSESSKRPPASYRNKSDEEVENINNKIQPSRLRQSFRHQRYRSPLLKRNTRLTRSMPRMGSSSYHNRINTPSPTSAVVTDRINKLVTPIITKCMDEKIHNLSDSDTGKEVNQQGSLSDGNVKRLKSTGDTPVQIGEAPNNRRRLNSTNRGRHDSGLSMASFTTACVDDPLDTRSLLESYSKLVDAKHFIPDFFLHDRVFLRTSENGVVPACLYILKITAQASYSLSKEQGIYLVMAAETTDRTKSTKVFNLVRQLSDLLVPHRLDPQLAQSYSLAELYTSSMLQSFDQTRFAVDDRNEPKFTEFVTQLRKVWEDRVFKELNRAIKEAKRSSGQRYQQAHLDYGDYLIHLEGLVKNAKLLFNALYMQLIDTGENTQEVFEDLRMSAKHRLRYHRDIVFVKAQRNIAMSAFEGQKYPGLVHFCYIHRFNNKIKSPSLQVAPDDTSKSAAVQRDLKRRYWKIVPLFYKYLAQGYSQMSVTDGDFVFTFGMEVYNEVSYNPSHRGKADHFKAATTPLGDFNGTLYRRLLKDHPPGEGLVCLELITVHLACVPRTGGRLGKPIDVQWDTLRHEIHEAPDPFKIAANS